MDVFEAIRERRSVKNFTDGTITREQIEQLLATVVLAPNHRMTEPWRFHVLGPEARRAWGVALGNRKAKRVEDPEAAQAVIDKVANAHEAYPAMIAVSLVREENPEIAEEDYAAAFMGIQNLSLAAHAMGLSAQLKTGAVMDDPAARAAVGLPDDERIIAVIELGEPEAMPEPKKRQPAAELTTWVD